MPTTGEIIAALITGLIAFACLLWTFYHIDTFMSNLFGNLLILVIGIICALIACAEGGIMGGTGST